MPPIFKKTTGTSIPIDHRGKEGPWREGTLAAVTVRAALLLQLGPVGKINQASNGFRGRQRPP